MGIIVSTGLSIENDTEDTYLVKLVQGPEQEARRIASEVGDVARVAENLLGRAGLAAFTTFLIEKEGFIEIRPGWKHIESGRDIPLVEMGDYSRVAVCVRFRQNPDNKEEMVIDAVCVALPPRPNGPVRHKIKSWVVDGSSLHHKYRSVVRIKDDAAAGT